VSKPAIALLLLFGFSTTVIGQTPAVVPKDAVATEETQRLAKKATGRHEQVVVSVEMCELLLNKARDVVFNVEGIDSKLLKAKRFGDAIASGQFDTNEKAEGAGQGKSGHEVPGTRVIENDETLKRVIAELEKAGALKVVARPTLISTSGRPASFHSGGKIEILVRQPNGDMTDEQMPVGTQLHIDPLVIGDETIRLQFRASISEVDTSCSVSQGESTVPGFHTTSINSTVEMGSGHTMVLAGLVERRVISEDPKVFEEVELIVLVRAEILLTR